MTTLHPKAASTGIGSALALLVLWILSYWVDIPTEVAVGITGIIATFCAWLAPWIPQPKPAATETTTVVTK